MIQEGNHAASRELWFIWLLPVFFSMKWSPQTVYLPSCTMNKTWMPAQQMGRLQYLIGNKRQTGSPAQKGKW